MQKPARLGIGRCPHDALAVHPVVCVVTPKLLNYIGALYLIAVGLIGLLGLGAFISASQ